MNTMHLAPNPTPTDLTTLSNVAIETFFSAAGLNVSVVPHCDGAACAACFGREPARAA